MFNHSFPTCTFFFYVEISSRTLIPLLMPGSVHSGSASWYDCVQMFNDKLLVSSFPDRFPHYAQTVAWSAHSHFMGSRVYACLGVPCHLHIWQNDRGLLCATTVTQGWKGHWIRVEKKILPSLLPGFKLSTFRSRVRRSWQWDSYKYISVFWLLHVRNENMHEFLILSGK